MCKNTIMSPQHRADFVLLLYCIFISFGSKHTWMDTNKKMCSTGRSTLNRPCRFCRHSMKIPVGFPQESLAQRSGWSCNLRLSVCSVEQIQIRLTLLQHSSHTSGRRREGAAHLEFAGEGESERRAPLLTSCTSAASTTTTRHWRIRTQLNTMWVLYCICSLFCSHLSQLFC